MPHCGIYGHKQLLIHHPRMKQPLQTFLVLFLILLLSSLAPATQVDDSRCQSSESTAGITPTCCQAMASMMADVGCAETVPAEHGCPRSGWCQMESGPEMLMRAHGGSQPLDYTGQYVTVTVQPPQPDSKNYATPQRISLTNADTQRYILLCSFLI